MYKLYTQHFDFFNEHAGETVFSVVQSDISRRLNDKASFERRNNLFILAPHLSYLRSDFKNLTPSQLSARYKNSHETSTGSELKQKAVVAMRALVRKLLNNTFKPYDPSSFNEFSVKFANLKTTNTQFPRLRSNFMKKKLLDKAQNLFSLMNSDSKKQSYSKTLDDCFSAFNESDYELFNNLHSNYTVNQEHNLQANINNLED